MRRYLPLILTFIAVAGIIIYDRFDGIFVSRGPSAETIALGKRHYAAQCASCHGANLQGQPNWRTPNPDGTLPAPPHDASGHTWHHTDAQLIDYIKRGGAAVAPPGFKSAMPGFAGVLSDKDIDAVLAYIKSTWPEEIRARQSGVSSR